MKQYITKERYLSDARIVEIANSCDSDACDQSQTTTFARKVISEWINSQSEELPEPAIKETNGYCCGNYTTGAEYMGQTETLCCGQYEERMPNLYTEDQLRAALAAQSPAPVVPQGFPHAIGVSVDFESPGQKSILVSFERRLTDDELRLLHIVLSAAPKP